MITGPATFTATEAELLELRARCNDLAVLCDTIRDLTSTISTKEVLQRLLRRTLKHLDSEIASILILGHDGKLRIAHARGLPDDVISETCVAPGEGISGCVAEAGEALLIQDIESHPRFGRTNHERYYTRSAISVPIRIHGRVLGVINVNNKQTHEPYRSTDLQLVEAIAAQAAIALTNARRYEEVLEQAQRDSLTGLANHGHFWQGLGIEMKRAHRHDRDLTVAIIDIDHFKRYNDAHGHLAGDAVLVTVAEMLRDGSRSSDLPARHGGDEFAIVLPETCGSGGFAFGEKMCETVAQHAFPGCEPGDVTISVGVASFPDQAETATRLVELADGRLYRAKAAGRNRVHAFS